VNWRALITVVTLGVMIAWGLRALQGSPEADFTAEEKAMLERLEPLLDTLVLQQEDLSSLPGHFEPCEGGEPYALQYGSDGASPDVEDIQVVEPSEAPASYSDFCDADGRAFVSSIVALPKDKGHLLFLRAAYEELTRADNEQALRQLVDASFDDLSSAEEVIDYRWVTAPTIGDWRYAWARTVDNPDMDRPLEVYHFQLVRNVVLGGVLIEVPSGATVDEQALAVVQAFDNRIAAQLELLAAEVQAP